MNKKLIIVLLVLVILVIVGLGTFLYYQSLNKSVKPIVTNQNLNSPTIINMNQNINKDIGLPTVTTPAMQGTPVINTNSSLPDYQPVNISISNFAFRPQNQTVKIGTTVTWTNDDPAPHQIAGSNFGSQPLNTGDSFSFTFTKAGTYDYHCAIHPSMTGQIIVQ